MFDSVRIIVVYFPMYIYLVITIVKIRPVVGARF
jgi:hypothetical protein